MASRILRSPGSSRGPPKGLRRRACHRSHQGQQPLADSLYRTAIAGGGEGVTAAIFWLKARAGWKETSVHELALTDSTHGPLVIRFVEPDMTRIDAVAAQDRERRSSAVTLVAAQS
jgi:hypothetical protein